MLFIQFFENSLTTEEKVQQIIQYISNAIELKEKPVIEKNEEDAFYISVSDQDMNDVLDFSKKNIPMNFSISNSNLRSWISQDKREPIEYSFEAATNSNSQRVKELAQTVEEEEDIKETDSEDPSSDSEESDDENDELQVGDASGTDATIIVSNDHNMKDIVEKRNKRMCKEECYERICSAQKKTHPFMTKYEKTRLMCIRAQQIINGANILVDIPVDKQNDIYYIVGKELEQKKLPLIVRRYLPNGEFEDWKANELSVMH